jgi:1-acyl-sn-glycerol-3-phosphate acyltransferase
VKKPWFLSLVRRYVRRTARQQFDGVRVAGLEQARQLSHHGPLLFAANHVCWWDAFMMVLVDEALASDGYALMDERNLAASPFFGAIGAVPLNTEGGLVGRRQLMSAVGLLSAPRRVLWIFPQGKQRPSHIRPLGFKPGVRLLVDRARCRVLPVAVAYLYDEAPVPSLWVHIGAPVVAGEGVVRRLEDAVVDGLAVIDAAHDDPQVASTFAVLSPARPRVGPESGLGAALLRWWFGKDQQPVIGSPLAPRSNGDRQ